jgi:hypothetical protein
MVADSGGAWFDPWPVNGLFVVIFLSFRRMHEIRPRMYLPRYISCHHLPTALRNSLLIYCKMKHKWGLEYSLEVCTTNNKKNVAISRDFGNCEGRGEHLRRKFVERRSRIFKQTNTHTHICICVCVYIYIYIYIYIGARGGAVG